MSLKGILGLFQRLGALKWGMQRPWSDRGLFHEALQNFFTSFVDLPVSLVWDRQGERRWSSLVQSQQSPNLVQFEASLGQAESRRKHHRAPLAKLKRTGQAVVAEHAGAFDAYVPLVERGKVVAALVSGPFFTEVPSATDLQANFKALAGVRPKASSALLEYARVALATPVLDGPLLKAYLRGLAIAAHALVGDLNGAQCQAAYQELQVETFGPQHPWRSWRYVELRRDRRFWSVETRATLMPWDKAELGLSLHPRVAFAVALQWPSSSKHTELEALALNAAMQRHCFRWARGQAEAVGGRLDQTGACILWSPSGKTAAGRVRQAARELGQALATELRKQFGLMAAIGISRLDAPPEDLPESMHEAAVALQLGLKLGRELSFFDDESKAAQGSGPLRLMARLGELRDAYSKALVPEAALAADQFVADVLLQSRLSVEVMRLHFRYAFSALQTSLAHRALLPPNRLVEFERQWLGRLEAEETPHGLSTAFREGLQAYFGATSSPSEGDRALRLEQARRYVDEHCFEPISIKAAAAAGGFSASRFSRLFAEATGVGFGAYLLQRRLDQAKLLLRQSKLPLQQIAFDSGFNSLSYFSQAFKRETGMNPSRFRNKYKIN